MSLQVLQKTCFVAGTPILTPTGSQPIESLTPGMTVLARPEGNLEAPVRPRRIEEVFKLAAPVVELHVGGQVIETTAEHPFFVQGKGWLPTNELMAGDRLAGHDGRWTPVQRIVDAGRVETVYNMRVADDHTYFVGHEDWGFSVWAHNAYSVRQAANGTWEVVDDTGNVIPTNGIFTDEAAALNRVNELNALEVLKNAPAWKQYEQRFGGHQTPMSTTFQGKTINVRLDKPPSGSTIIDFKHYDWANPRYQDPFIQGRVVDNFTMQIKKYKTIRPNVHLQFSQEPPAWVIEAIKNAGGTYSAVP